MFLHVVLPVLLPITLFFLLGVGNFRSRLTGLFSLHSDESLIRQKLFWISLSVPVALFVSFGIVCWKGYQLDLSSSGISTFLTISTFPLALLSAAIPLGVVVASFHSTQQTAEQIRQASLKNNLEAYYLHRTEFFKHFERHERVNYLDVLVGQFEPHPLLYVNCSPGSPEEGVPKRNDAYFRDIDASFSSAAMFMDIVFRREYSDFVFDAYLANACVSIHAISHLLGLPEIYRELAGESLLVEPPPQQGQEVIKYLTVGTKSAHIVAAFRYAWDFYANLAAFYGYKVPELPQHLQYISTGGKVFSLPGWSNVSRFKEELQENYVKYHGFKVTNPSDIIPEEIVSSE
ncbi:hypothetical protein F1602_01565 [Pseudomonas putida]|nr:hypothetical protein F1602_01565 [Pseudomonas putida]